MVTLQKKHAGGTKKKDPMAKKHVEGAHNTALDGTDESEFLLETIAIETGRKTESQFEVIFKMFRILSPKKCVFREDILSAG
jgi:hypothetical protein